MNDIKEKLQIIKEKNLYREMRYLSKSQDKYTVIDGREILLMSSNNYLGLANNEEVKKAAIDGINEFGLGSGGSRLTTGSYDLHKKLEEKIAKFKNCEAALIFNTGYMANVGVISAICDENYYIFSDELNHASIIDGCKLAKGKTIVYKHNNMEDLYDKISTINPTKGIIVTDSVFSMDGDIANIPEIVKIAKAFNLLTVLDDAHATGVIGKNGRGSSEYFNCKVDITIGTLSKAVASEGGFVCADEYIIDYLKNKARSFIFSTALSPGIINGSIKSFELIASTDRVQRLNNNIKYINKKLNEIGIETDENRDSPIIPIFIGDEDLAMNISKSLLENGIYIPAIRYPTVPLNKSILRMTIMSTHDKKDLDIVVDKLKHILIENNIIN
ncbi:MAG: 8-amino-7-oxononanoate synthase [Terrisporobacter othiniensis]|uniref:8-amino-7-oxononanoate synthase n=1 Tax=Terrisporobacter othiniensis TaxID=1577792 RepID=UPI002A748CAE|nr:8-amino-7-oxononanoate synthase [Terrisporobacter othiniensis]MDY3375113.1 8-amino-7-oxononanoate synthase [Terrisporobacter othiniensis]